MKDFGLDTKIVWKDRKRFLGMPLSFTRYYLVKKEDSWAKIFTSIGLLSTYDEEVQLFRIFDLSLYQSFFDKMFNVGTITLHCNDKSNSKIYLVKIKRPYEIRNLIASMIEEDRKGKRFSVAELQN